jgi:hypothetical protein
MNNKSIKSNGFYVNYCGDSSVGIFDQEWVVSGEFWFCDEENKSYFEGALASAFEYVCGDLVRVESFEDRLISFEEEDAMLDPSYIEENIN